MIFHRRVLSLLVRLLLLMLFSLSAQAAEKNIIFFITDDESLTLGCYGDPVAVKFELDDRDGFNLYIDDVSIYEVQRLLVCVLLIYHLELLYFQALQDID